MVASQKHWRVLSNDDGWIMGTYGPPLTPDDMRDKMIAPYAGSPVDVFSLVYWRTRGLRLRNRSWRTIR